MTILGGGGAATALIAQASLNGASHINIFNQTQFLEATREKAQEFSDKTGVSIAVYPVEDLKTIQEKVLDSQLFRQCYKRRYGRKSMINYRKF